MKLSERIRQTAKSKELSASVWDNWEVSGWKELADEVSRLERIKEAAKKFMLELDSELREGASGAMSKLRDALESE